MGHKNYRIFLSSFTQQTDSSNAILFPPAPAFPPFFVLSTPSRLFWSHIQAPLRWRKGVQVAIHRKSTVFYGRITLCNTGFVCFLFSFPHGWLLREDGISFSPASPSWVGFAHLLCSQSLLSLSTPCSLPGNPSNTATQALLIHKLPLKTPERAKLTQEKKNKQQLSLYWGLFSPTVEEIDLNEWSLSSNSGKAKSKSKAPLCSAGDSHTNHLASLYKSIMLVSAFRTHHALGLHCWKSMYILHASKALALTPTDTHRYILCFLTEKHIPSLTRAGVLNCWQGDSVREILDHTAQLGPAYMIKHARFLPVMAVFPLDYFLHWQFDKNEK